MGGTVTRQPQSASAAAALRARVTHGAPLLLDGAMGTELERRGARASLPLWSTHALLEAPELVERIHRDFLAAGAEVLTANTFRTQARTLARSGGVPPGRVEQRAAALTAGAVGLARHAVAAAQRRAGVQEREPPAARRIFVAGSAPPLEDCYRPDLAPDDASLAREHRAHAANLAAAGVDLLLAETHHTVREACAVARAAVETGLPLWASFVCDADARLLSGEPLAEALAALAPFDPLLVGVNCLPARAADAALAALVACGRPFAVYANRGSPGAAAGDTDALDPEAFADAALRWVAAGARAVGGCCGTGPGHVAALARRLRSATPVCDDSRAR